MGREGYKLIKLLGVEGNKVDILPQNSPIMLTELHCKKELIDTSYMGAIAWCKKWKKFVLVDLHDDFQMSRDCLNEAFDMTEKYWKDNPK